MAGEFCGGRGSRTRHRGASGFSLLEVLIVVAVVLPLVIAAAQGLLVTARSSATNEERQRLETALTSYAEALKLVGYIDCADAAGYNAAYPSDPNQWEPPAGSGIQLEVVGDVRTWDPDTEEFGTGPCTAPDRGVQQLELEVSRNGMTVSGWTTKRNPGARP